MTSEAFGHWFAGFVDGEGCFHIKRVGPSFVCVFILGMRRDDEPILREIVEWTGLGDVFFTRPGREAQARWEVARKAEVVQLVEIFERYPLRSRKAADFVIWREAVALWQAVVPRERHDWSRIAELKRELEEGRRLRLVA